jgi:hypothetical protein
MTNRHPAFDSSLNRDVCDGLAAAVLVAFAALIMLLA